jgi:hypothetical protein
MRGTASPSRALADSPVHGSVDGRSGDAEKFSDLARRVGAGAVQLHEVSLLRGSELGLSAAELAGDLRDRLLRSSLKSNASGYSGRACFLSAPHVRKEPSSVGGFSTAE